jgi:hypothetical protein
MDGPRSRYLTCVVSSMSNSLAIAETDLWRPKGDTSVQRQHIAYRGDETDICSVEKDCELYLRCWYSLLEVYNSSVYNSSLTGGLPLSLPKSTPFFDRHFSHREKKSFSIDLSI